MVFRIIILSLLVCTCAKAQDDVIYSDNGEYGNYYTGNIYGDGPSEIAFEIDFNNLGGSVDTISAGLPSTSDQIDSRRDVALSFTGLTIGRNGFFIYVNNILRNDVGLYVGQKEFQVMLNRNHFTQGNNSIQIRRYYPSSWGLTNILAKFNPVIPITIGQKDTTLYGYSQTPARYTGLRISFNLASVVKDNYAFEAKGWDIDEANETQVFLNNKSIGYLSTSPSSMYAMTNRFLLKKGELLAGVNLIEFQQRFPDSQWSGFEDEKWAVTDLLIEAVKPNLAPILDLLLFNRQ